MISAFSVEQIRAAEADAMTATPPGALMQQAAFGVAMATVRLLRRSGGVSGRRVALLVGTGGNGGDALYAGRDLIGRGVQVTALLADPDRTYPGALPALQASGGAVLSLDDDDASRIIDDADVVIDGLVGLGSGRPVGLPAAVAAAVRNARVVAVDVPSGVDVDTGAAAPDSIRADVTVTFGVRRYAHLLDPARQLCGQIELVDIGLDHYLPEPSVHSLGDDDVRRLWPVAAPDDHKYSSGVVGIAAGSLSYRGAAVLAVGGAVRAKPGMVRYLGPEPLNMLVLGRWPEAVLAESLEQAGRTDAWVVGPGLGTDERARDLLDAALDSPLPLVIDADALTMLADRLPQLTSRAAATVLTPHLGEFRRVFGGEDRGLVAARRAAQECGAVVLLKGPTTVVAAPDGQAFVNASGTPRLATAGTGDVLSGMIGALLASQLPPATAAALAAHAHGRAAQLAPITPSASGLPDALAAYLHQALG